MITTPRAGPHRARAPQASRTNAHSLLVNAILVALSREGCRVWKQHTGAARPLSTPEAVVRYGTPGAADITGLLPGGRRLEVEVKTGTGRQSPEQRAYQAMITSLGGLYVVARTVHDAVEAVRAAKAA